MEVEVEVVFGGGGGLWRWRWSLMKVVIEDEGGHSRWRWSFEVEVVIQGVLWVLIVFWIPCRHFDTFTHCEFILNRCCVLRMVQRIRVYDWRFMFIDIYQCVVLALPDLLRSGIHIWGINYWLML